ncbi:MAG: hypothetical protein MUO31_04775 [Thermodesulfovibrionales bacterium]|nr:hypothetical protein [Thermodesulfovibrionales bacterium]
MSKKVSLIIVLFSVLAMDAAARQVQPPLAAGQRAWILASTEAYPYLDITAEILHVDDNTVTVRVTKIESTSLGQELKGRVIELPRRRIREYDVVTAGDLAAGYIGITVMILVVVVPLAFLFLKFSREERRRRWQKALPGVMMILGGFGGLGIGAIMGTILVMDKYEVTSITGKRGIPAEIVTVIICVVLFGFLGYRYGLIRQLRLLRKGKNGGSA